MGFCTPNYPALVFQFWSDSLHRLRSYCWETARRSIRPNFSVHPVGKPMRWIEKWMAPFLMVSTCSITMQSSEKIVQRAPAVGAMVFVRMSVFVTLAPRPAGALFVRAGILWAGFVLLFMGRFWCRFQRFSEGTTLSDGLDSSYFCC